MTTATNEELFIKKLDPNELFEKEATIARMPDDDKKWPETVLSELHKQLPFLSGMDVSLNFTRIQPEAGYGFGYALVRGQASVPSMIAKKDTDMVKIPIVVADRHLEPFHVFNLQGRTIPLTRSRFEEAMENPAVFAGPETSPKTQKSLIDQLYPPYQQRQGFGRIGEGSGVTGGGMGKMAADVSNMTPAQLKRLGTLKQYEGIDRANAALSNEDKIKQGLDSAAFSAAAGAGVAALKAKKGISAKALAAKGGKGALLGAGLSALGTGYRHLKAKRRAAQRQEEPYSSHFKEASVSENPLSVYNKYLMGGSDE